MRRLLPLCLVPALSACSVFGDYDRPYDSEYRPLEPVVIAPFATLPDAGLPPDASFDEIDEGLPALGPETGRACEPVDLAWPAVDPMCLDLCNNPPDFVAPDCDSSPSYRAFMTGVCVELCESRYNLLELRGILREFGEEMFCPEDDFDPCPIACQVCDDTYTPTGCWSICDDAELWQCVGHTVTRTDRSVIEDEEGDDDYRIGVLGGAASACLGALYDP